MKPVSKTYTITATDADGICTSQTPAAGGALTIDGALLAGIPTAQHVTVASDGADTGRTFTIVGLDNAGNSITEDITGPSSGTSTSTKNYKQVTSVVVDAATAGAITVGFVQTAELPWQILNYHASVFNYAYHVVIGACTFTVEGTMDDVEDSTATISTNTVQASGSSSVYGSSTAPIRAVRVKLTAWTSGTIKFNVMQAGI